MNHLAKNGNGFRRKNAHPIFQILQMLLDEVFINARKAINRIGHFAGIAIHAGALVWSSQDRRNNRLLIIDHQIAGYGGHLSAAECGKEFVTIRTAQCQRWLYFFPVMVINCIKETLGLTKSHPEIIRNINVDEHRMKVNQVLIQISELVRRESVGKQTKGKKQMRLPERGADMAGKDLRHIDLKGANLRGALLIAANLKGADLTGADVIGADLRDTNIKGANLSQSLFLTQAQINAAMGDDTTLLPDFLVRPLRWRKTIKVQEV